MSPTLPANRSMPAAAVIPVLLYGDVHKAADWLCRVLGFTERLRIGAHRIQLNAPHGNGTVVVAEGDSTAVPVGHSVMLRVVDVDGDFQRAQAAGAKVLAVPATHPYGERQCTVVDGGNHVWTLSQTVGNVDPKTWGGEWVGEP